MDTQSAPRVTAIILNFNRLPDTLTCLASLAGSQYPRLDVMVLNFFTTDETAAAIRAEYPGVQLVEMTDNRGYAGNNNVGIQRALEQGAEWLLVMNEDVTLAPDCIDRLVAAARADPRVGIVGPMVYHASEPGVIQSAGMGLDRYWRSFHYGENDDDHGQFGAARQVDGISGCAIMLRAEMLKQIGAFSAHYFYYYEETELCFRAARDGWTIVLEPAARLWHAGVQRDYRPNANVTYYKTRNHLMMLAKHHAPLRIWLHEWWDNLRTLAAWTIKPKWRDKRDHRDALAQGIFDYLRHRTGKRVT